MTGSEANLVPTAVDCGDEMCLGCDTNLGHPASSEQHRPIDCVVVLNRRISRLEREEWSNG